jgi:phage terminase small subunit
MSKRGRKPLNDAERKARRGARARNSAPLKRAKAPKRPKFEGTIADQDDSSQLEHVADAKVIRPPAWLSKNDQAIFTDVAPMLQRRRLLSTEDVLTFARYCQWLGRYLEADKASRGRSLVYSSSSYYTKNGQKIDRLFQVLDRIDTKLAFYEDRFGMNPRERTNIFAKLAGSRLPGAADHPPTAGDKPADAKEKPSPVGILRVVGGKA